MYDISIQLCGQTTCAVPGCVSGVHLPASTVAVSGYSHRRGTSFHLDSACGALRNVDAEEETRLYDEVESRLCRRCAAYPPAAVVEYRTAAGRLAVLAQQVILNALCLDSKSLDSNSLDSNSLDSNSLDSNSLDSAAALVAQARSRLVASSWPAPLDLAVAELAYFADHFTGSTGPGPLPPALGDDLRFAAAVELIGADTDPRCETGVRPLTRYDRAAAAQCPNRVLDTAWQTWSSARRAGTIPAAYPAASDTFPDRDAAVAALTGEWERLMVARAGDPTPQRVVVVPLAPNDSRDDIRPWLVRELAKHAVADMPAGRWRFGGGAVVIVPQVVAEVLPRLDVHGAADLGPWRLGDHPALVQTALGLWDQTTYSTLRTCVDGARNLLSAAAH